MMKVHENIRNMREMSNFTQEEMAEKLNMTASGYAKIERGITQLKLEKLEQIADIFNMDTIELLELGQDGGIVVQLPNNSGENATANYYLHSDPELKQEVEKLKLQIQHQKEIIEYKDVIINQKDQEIQILKEMVNLLKQNKL